MRTLLFLLSALTSAFAPSTLACTCVGPAPPATAMAVADVVFAGTVTDRYDAASGSEISSSGDPIVYTFQVTSMWKGRLTEVLRVVSERSGASCGAVFDVGSSYLVYASSDPDREDTDEGGSLGWGVLTAKDAAAGTLRTELCTRTRPLVDAVEDLAALPPPLFVRDGGIREPVSLPQTLEMLKEDDGKLRLTALNALVRLEHQLVPLPPALERFLVGSEAEALTLVGMLERIALRDVEGVRWLARALDHPSAVVRGTAAVAMGKVGRPDEKGIRALAAGLADGVYAVRRDCAEALGRFGPAAAPAVSALVRALDDEAEPVRASAARALAAIGPAAHEAVPVLASRMGGMGADDWNVPDAAKALAAMGGEGLDSLCRALAGSNVQARSLAAMALAEMEATPREAIPALTPLLEDESMLVRLSAARALARTEEGREAAMTLFVSLLEHGTNMERAQAAHALLYVGPAGRTAEAALIRLLADQDAAVRIAAVRAIGAIGTTRRETWDAVARLQQSDANPSVRESARRVLARQRSVSSE